MWIYDYLGINLLIKDPKVKLCKAHASKYRLKSSMGQTRDTNGIDNWIVELFIDLLYGRDVELWLLISKTLIAGQNVAYWPYCQALS